MFPAMRQFLRGLLAVSCLALIAGCETAPQQGGYYQPSQPMTPAETLTPEQEQVLREAQAREQARRAEEARAREEARLRRQAEEAHRRAVREEAERLAAERERHRIAEMHRHARPSEIVHVTITDGMLAFYGKRREYEPVTFDLVRGEHRMVRFRRKGSHDITEVEVALSEDGRTFFFDVPSRRRYALIDRDWVRGEEYHPEEIRGNDGHSEAFKITIRIKRGGSPGRGRDGPPSRDDRGRGH